MIIQRFLVTNFRSLERVEIKQMRSLVMLFGRNGSGKSNILAALEAIFAPKVAQLLSPTEIEAGTGYPPAPFWRGYAFGFIHNFHRDTASPVEFEVDMLLNKRELFELWPEGQDIEDKVIPSGRPDNRMRLELAGRFIRVPEIQDVAQIILDYCTLNESNVLQASEPIPWFPELSEFLTAENRRQLSESLLGSLNGLFSVVSADRFLRRETMNAPDQDNRIGAARGATFKRRLNSLKTSPRQNDQQRFRQIEAAYNHPVRHGEIDFGQSPGSDDELEVMVWNDDGTWLPASRRGAGSEQLLILISELSMSESRIIGIEEMESNLDEVNQKNFHDMLTRLLDSDGSSPTQVIATAHSSYYAKMIGNPDRRLVAKNRNGRTSVTAWTKKALNSLFKPDNEFV